MYGQDFGIEFIRDFECRHPGYSMQVTKERNSIGQAFPEYTFEIRCNGEVDFNVFEDMFFMAGNRRKQKQYLPEIEKVIFNNPATIVFWKDKTKTVVKCQDEDTFDYMTGLAMCISKKALGNRGKYYDTFKKYINEEVEYEKTFQKLLHDFNCYVDNCLLHGIPNEQGDSTREVDVEDKVHDTESESEE